MIGVLDNVQGIKQKYFVIVLLVVLSSYAFPSASTNVPQIGVEDGNSFDFTIQELDYLFAKYYVGWDSETFTHYYGVEGDEFTISFTNPLPYQSILGDYILDSVITFKDSTFETWEYLQRSIRTFSSFTDRPRMIISTDLDIMISYFQDQIDLLNSEISNEEKQVGGYYLINTDTEIGIKGGYDDIDEIKTLTSNSEFRMEKSTGVLLYEHYIRYYTSASDETELSPEEILRDHSMVIVRNGYDYPDSTDRSTDVTETGFLLGFEFSTIVITFSVVMTSVVFRNKRLIVPK